MMLPYLLSAFLLAAAVWVSRSSSFHAARRVGVVACGAVLVSAIVALAIGHQEDLPGMPAEVLDQVLVVISAIGLVSIALSSARKHSIGTLVSVLLLVATATTFLGTRNPWVTFVLWVVSFLILARDLMRAQVPVTTRRLFVRHHVVSSLFFLVGLILQERGQTAQGTTCLLLAIAIREGMLPFHSWLPAVMEHGSIPTVMAFVGPQLGVYAQILNVAEGHHVILGLPIETLGAATAITAAFLGLAQKDARRGVAYLILSQTGLVLFGLESHSAVARGGALLTWQVLGVATSGLALCVSALTARRGRLEVGAPNGHYQSTPALAVSFLIFGFASVGFPLTLGFVAEDLLVQGAVENTPALGLCLVLATALNGMTVMRMYFALFTGRREGTGEADLVPRERWVLAILLAGVVGSGIAPTTVVRRADLAADQHPGSEEVHDTEHPDPPGSG